MTAMTPIDVRDRVDDACANCGRRPLRPRSVSLDGNWLAEPDGHGGLNVFCPECWQREFGTGT